MKIFVIKKSLKRLISSDAKIASSFADRLLGLLNPHLPRHLVFHTHFGIHTLFLSLPIDVLVLDSKGRIVKTANNLLPYRLFFYHPKHSTVIEMPQNTISQLQLGINDKISIE
ncbi:MAG TPA: DUF192 domain-containing protein [Candidatus Woesebacteria bacterium]|nr:DUF192 domain-containing protein [Candidatus Woesebacteria bacterium]